MNFSCRAEGFSTLSYSWFTVESGSDIGMEIRNATNPTYTISNPIYNQNNTGYYCVATNNEGIAVSNTSTLTGNASFIIFGLSTSIIFYAYINMFSYIQFSDLPSLISPSLHNQLILHCYSTLLTVS